LNCFSEHIRIRPRQLGEPCGGPSHRLFALSPSPFWYGRFFGNRRRQPSSFFNRPRQHCEAANESGRRRTRPWEACRDVLLRLVSCFERDGTPAGRGLVTSRRRCQLLLDLRSRAARGLHDRTKLGRNRNDFTQEIRVRVSGFSGPGPRAGKLGADQGTEYGHKRFELHLHEENH
jgi:hypothetical protein